MKYCEALLSSIPHPSSVAEFLLPLHSYSKNLTFLEYPAHALKLLDLHICPCLGLSSWCQIWPCFCKGSVTVCWRTKWLCGKYNRDRRKSYYARECLSHYPCHWITIFNAHKLEEDMFIWLTFYIHTWLAQGKKGMVKGFDGEKPW